MHSLMFHSIYKATSQRLFSNTGYNIVWNDDENDLPPSVLGFLNVFSKKPTSTLSSSAFISYPIYFVFLNPNISKGNA